MQTENFNAQYINSDNATIENLTVTNSFTNNSDRRLKTNIKNLNDDYISLLKLIQPVTFCYKNNKKEKIGFIAQDVEEAFIKRNLTNIPVKKDDVGIYSMDYIQLIPILWKISQKQQEMIENQENTINELQEKIKRLEEK